MWTLRAIQTTHDGPTWRLLDDSVRTGVRPDSVQVLDGMLSWRLPTSVSGVAFSVCVPVGHRAGAWLKRGLPSSK